MTNPNLARDYLHRAEKRLKAVALLLDEEAFADVVRESQEVVDEVGGGDRDGARGARHRRAVDHVAGPRHTPIPRRRVRPSRQPGDGTTTASPLPAKGAKCRSLKVRSVLAPAARAQVAMTPSYTRPPAIPPAGAARSSRS